MVSPGGTISGPARREHLWSRQARQFLVPPGGIVFDPVFVFDQAIFCGDLCSLIRKPPATAARAPHARSALNQARVQTRIPIAPWSHHPFIPLAPFVDAHVCASPHPAAHPRLSPLGTPYLSRCPRIHPLRQYASQSNHQSDGRAVIPRTQRGDMHASR